MTASRQDRLRVLGLSPLWRLRARASAPAPMPGPTAVADAAEPASAAPSAPAVAADSGQLWADLRREVLTCTRCPLHASRTQGVLGVGDVNADWLFVGEAPGADEDRLGEPFVGQAGKLLDAMLAAVSLKRGDNVYIANVLKSRPPSNRNPKAEEVAACLPYLERQIDLIRPRLIVAMGRFAAQSLLLSDASISQLRGKVHAYRGVPLVVTYHPAYLLRNLPDKAKSWEDLCLARAVMAAGKAATGSVTAS